MGEVLQNDRARRTLGNHSSSEKVRRFHRCLPGYAPTPLHCCRDLAASFGIASLHVKVESNRFGLPAFKVLGGSWAIYRQIEDACGIDLDDWTTLDELKAIVSDLNSLLIATATDGNHGRGVAWFARQLGVRTRVYVPDVTVAARIEAIEDEGADVVVVDGPYDEAVRRAAEEQASGAWLIQDTSWPGYEDVAPRVIEGYGTMFAEIDEQLAAANAPPPDVVFVQTGVGSLAVSLVSHFRSPQREHVPAIVNVEPTVAACVLESFRAGEIVTIPGEPETIMAGLNCGTPATVAWPILRDGVDVFTTIDDERAADAMRRLADAGIVAGESGAAGLGGLVELLRRDGHRPARQALGLGSDANILVLSTEGATDPANYARLVGRDPASIGVAARD